MITGNEQVNDDLLVFCKVFTLCICAVSATVLFAVLIARAHHTQNTRNRAHAADCMTYEFM